MKSTESKNTVSMIRSKKQESSPKISIVLVSYNSWKWLELCLASFSNLHDWKQNKDQYQVIVVDNGSKEKTEELLSTHFPWVTFVGLKENRGFSGGNNAGLAHTNAPVVMLLNTDTEWLPDTNIDHLLNQFEKNPKLGVLTPRVVLADGSLDHGCHRGFPTLWNSFTYFSGLARMFPKVPLFAGYLQSWKDLTHAHQVDACSGAAMLVRQSTMNEVGLLDESFFMYGEDIDWCYRFKEAHWEVWYDPQVTVRHHKHKSGLGKRTWDTQRNTIDAFYNAMKLFFKKHYASQYPPLVNLLVFAMIDKLKNRKIKRERRHYDTT